MFSLLTRFYSEAQQVLIYCKPRFRFGKTNSWRWAAEIVISKVIKIDITQWQHLFSFLACCTSRFTSQQVFAQQTQKMGKRQHQKDKLYLTTTEWSTLYGGRRPGSRHGESSEFKRLPFDHCALSLQPFEHPLCTPEGIIYDIMNIVPYIKKYGTDPATGKPIEAKKLVRLNFVKNAEGKYHCPVLYKVFNENSHIVAIKTTGNVFSYEAVDQLNLRAKNFKDLLTDAPFTRQDIITLQDPGDLEKFNLSRFHHLKHNLKVLDPEEEKLRADPKYTLRVVSTETRSILDTLDKEYKPAEKAEKEVKKADKFNAAHYSTGAVAASFTSTVMEPTTSHEPAILADDVVRYAMIKKKGYVQLQTTHGNLNLELFCDAVPKTCENFVGLCKKGYYDGTKFHRSIRHFMVQGGDPTGTGKGGESLWGKPFRDEFKPNLVHQGRGVLSMANEGPDTNQSQFFVTYRSCRHLDTKHSVFGKLVGGLEALNAIEAVETDNKDRPIEDIVLLRAVVFVDPYEEVDEELRKKREEEEESKQREARESVQKKRASKALQEFHKGIGKYIDPDVTKKGQEEPVAVPVKRKLISGTFGDFSNW